MEKLFAYKRNGDTSNECTVCETQEEAEVLQLQGWYISPTEIIWAGENAKMFDVCGEVVDRPVIQPDPIIPYIPTKEQLLQKLDWDYQYQFVEITRA